jgi:membrane-associated phospholipid phosphatase
VNRSVTLPFFGAALCAAAFAALRAAAFDWPVARYVDAAALKGFLAFQGPLGENRAERLAELADPLPFLLGVAVLCLAGLLIGRFRHAVAAFLMLLGANVTTQLLKQLLAEPRSYETLGSSQVSDAAFPSGHATASMSLALAAVLVAPHAVRPVVAALGALYPVAVSYGFLSLGWHLPSDVVGGYLVATAWSLLALGGLRAAALAWPGRASRSSTTAQRGTAAGPGGSPSRGSRGFALMAWTTLATMAVLGVAASVAAFRFREPLLDYAERYTAFFAVAGAIALAAIVLLAMTTALTARRSR